MANNDVNAILIDEYKSLWHYYICQINVLSGFRDLYMKIFLVPSGIISAAAVTFSKSLSDKIAVSADSVFLSIAILLGIAFFMGMALFISYYKELGNMGNYEQAMIEIREYLWENNHLESVLTIEQIRRNAPIFKFSKKESKIRKIISFYRSLLYSLGAIFIIGNSFLVTVVMFFLSKSQSSIVTYSSISSPIWFSLVPGILVFLILSIWSYRLYYYYTSAAAAELPIRDPHATTSKN